MDRNSYWPLLGLRITTPHLELRYPDDELAFALAELAGRGIHDPASMPFGVPWTDTPPVQLERQALQHYWLQRATTAPAEWSIDFAVLVNGEVVGCQGVMTKDFPTRRTFTTGSWVGQSQQGRGIGKEMRQAVLHFGFEGLGATTAETAAWHDNAASLGVTRHLGYEPNGEGVELRRNDPDRMLRFRMERAQWEQARRADIHLLGLEPCLPLLVGPT
jgi:RimJ/RimL family protein N-acetyltransferase